ncbi:hypothetical protein BMS3Bbin16_01243 [archaeon BMS3Bbin16]|nr:hypothetical protein BMS3Bbin16_01243 [archaeon BMS3Bbin16]
MDTERTERLWQAVMNVAVAMKKEGIETGDVAARLRDAKVLLNHCIYDEHAHGEELLAAELAVEAVQGQVISLLREIGREGDFSFDLPEKMAGRSEDSASGRPKKISPNRPWARIRVPADMSLEAIENIEGVEIVEREGETITIAGGKTEIQQALKEISKVYLK